MSMISKLYVSDWVITVNLWDLEDSPVTKLVTGIQDTMPLETRRVKEFTQNMPVFHIFRNVWNSFKCRHEALCIV